MSLGEVVSADAEGRQAYDNRIAALTEERDNLLHLRDQLAARAAAPGDHDGGVGVPNELQDLRATVARLTEQREQLALELSDARTEIESSRAASPQIQAEAGETTVGREPLSTNLLSGLISDLQPQMASISDYTELLLAESIGILGAAQRQVLQMLADDIGQLVGMINDVHGLAHFETTRFHAGARARRCGQRGRRCAAGADDVARRRRPSAGVVAG